MTEFFVAIGAFLLAHTIPPAPPVRARLVRWLGLRVYLACYALVSTALLAWIVVAARHAPYVEIWTPAAWQALVPIVAMPAAFILVIAGLVEPNPLSISLRRAEDPTVAGAMATITRHPVLWGFLVWALAHIPPNGDVVSLLLFAGMALLAVVGMAVLDRRARRRLGTDRWRELARSRPLLPFAAYFSGAAQWRPSRNLLPPFAVAFLAYAWFLLQGHQWLIGRSPLAWLGR